MKRSRLVKHHRWLGVFLCFFVLAFCVSGIILNHRDAFASVDVGRGWLPGEFRYSAWNNGLLRGAIADPADSVSTLIYGNDGVWALGPDFALSGHRNAGFPSGVDNRNVRAMAVAADGSMWAATTSGVWQWVGARWVRRDLPHAGERISDLVARGDTVVAVGRSHIFVGDASGFEALELPLPAGAEKRQSLFRVAFKLHSGELFGLAGIIFMDIVGVALSILALTGIAFFIARSAKGSSKAKIKTLKHSLRWHKAIGAWAFAVLCFVTFTGWILRPPALLALVKAEVPLAHDNPWHDKLRAIRYDSRMDRWILHTSDGFYSLASLGGCVPEKIGQAPPVSVMGINAWFREEDSGAWVVGSFSGLYRWNSDTGAAVDYFTGEAAPQSAGPPFGGHPISGFAFGRPVEYYAGSDFAPMPEAFASEPMSLWNLALEVHTGRIYTFLGPGTLVFIFFAGALMAWLLITGWKLRGRAKRKQ